MRTHLSGPSLITALISLWKTRNAPSETVDAAWAMATVLYDRIRIRLGEAGPGEGRRTVRIILDDGAEPPAEEAEADRARAAADGPDASGQEPKAA